MIGSRKRLSKNNRSVATDGHVLGKEHSVNSMVPGQPPFTPMLHMKVSSCELASSVKHLGTILLVYDDISLNIRRYELIEMETNATVAHIGSERGPCGHRRLV